MYFIPFHTEAEPLEENVFLCLIIPLCHSDLFFQCVFGLFVQDFVPLLVGIFFGLMELSEFCSEPRFVVVIS